MSKRAIKVEVGGPIGFFGLLTVLFIGLKLTGYIDWPWWLVLLPLWGQIALILVVLGVVALYVGVAILWSFWQRGGKKP